MADIRTVIFDLGGVYFTDGTKEAITTICKRYDLSEELVTKVFKGELGTEYREGKISHDEYWERAKALWGIQDVSVQELAQIWLNGYRPINGTVETIEGLKKAGYQLALEKSSNSAENCVYIDDKPELLSPASELGMKTIPFINPDDLAKKLKALGLAWDRGIDR